MGVEITFFVDLQTPNVKHSVDFFACQIEFFFSGSVCLKTWVMAEQPVGKTSKLSSAIFRTC